MKKIVSILICFIFIISASLSLAENNVSLPGGLKFGMSMDEAVSASGYSIVDNNYWARANLVARGFDQKGFLQCVSGVTIGGIDVGTFQAFFANGGLKQVEYEFVDVAVPGDHKGDEPTSLDSFNKIEAILQEKYGDPVSSDKSNHQYCSTTYTYEWNPDRVGNMKRCSLYNREKTTRIIPLDDGGTLYIDNFIDLYWQGDADYMRGEHTFYYKHALQYTYYDYQVDNTQNSNDAGF